MPKTVWQSLVSTLLSSLCFLLAALEDLGIESPPLGEFKPFLRDVATTRLRLLVTVLSTLKEKESLREAVRFS